MKLHEYQAKALLAAYGVPTPRGQVAATPDEAAQAARSLGGKVVVKAQVYAGGRGKAGGIKVVDSPEAARDAAAKLLGTRLVTHQTGPEGAPVDRVLVEEAQPIAQEVYAAFTMDRVGRAPMAIASAAGGMDIEEVAARSPEKILNVLCDPVIGMQPFQGRRLAYAMGLKPELVRPFADIMVNLYRAFVERDASLIELNPLAVLADGRVVALDAKVNIDDNALFRHKDLEAQRDPAQEDPLEWEAANAGISYVTLDGDVGCLVNGAGLAMATMDTVRQAGAAPANFLDVGGGADETKVAHAVRIMLSDAKVKRVLVNIFGGILRCDQAALGVVAACRETKRTDVPILARLLGTNAQEARSILETSGLPVTFVDDLAGVAQALRRGA